MRVETIAGRCLPHPVHCEESEEQCDGFPPCGARRVPRKRSSIPTLLPRPDGIRRWARPWPCCGAAFLGLLILQRSVDHSLCLSFLSHAACAVLYTSPLGFIVGAGAAEPRASQRPKWTESISPNPLRQRRTRCHLLQLLMKNRTVDMCPPFQLSAVA